jgi:hypothetical protein
MKKTLTSLAMLLVVAACATPGQVVERGSPFSDTPLDEDRIRVHVQNDNFADARLYAIGRGVRRHLGTVTGKQVAVMDIPWTFGDPLRIEIDLLAGPKCTTRTIDADPGDELDLRIESILANTSTCY